MPMDIGVAGCLSLDIIKTHSYTAKSIGGIAYNILTLCADRDMVVYPITYIGHDLMEEFLKILPENCDRSCIKKCTGDNVNTIHVLGEKRYEFITPMSPKIDIDMLLCPDTLDVLFLNPVMGWEFTQETLQQINRVKADLKMMDVHNMTLGIGENGRRYRIRLSETTTKTIIENFHIIQMNKEEFFYFTGCQFPEGIKSMPEDKIFFITLDKEGAAVYYNNKLEYYSPQNIYTEDIIGAGDIAGSLFLLNYIKTKDPLFSGKLTVTMMNGLRGKDIISKVNSIKEIFIDTWEKRE